MPFLKIPSGEITNGPLLLEYAKSKKSIILSTGMATLGEVEEALGVLVFGQTSVSKYSNIDLLTLQLLC
jgi:sialic acid synthase SpsE